MKSLFIRVLTAVLTTLAGCTLLLGLVIFFCDVHCRLAANNAVSPIPAYVTKQAQMIQAIAMRHSPDNYFTPISFGVLICIVLSCGIVYLFTRQPTRDAKQLHDGLSAIATGKRDVRFAKAGINELDAISESATYLQERLRKEEQLRQQWTQDIAHDLRTPVAAIKLQLEAFRDGLLQASPERLERVIHESERLEHLVEDLSALAHIESPELKLKPGNMELHKMLVDLQNHCNFLAKAKKQTIQVQFQTPEAEWVYADRTLLERAVSNLLINAIQYSPEQSFIKVQLWTRKDAFEIAVENPGEIPEEALSKLFERLFRLETSRNTTGSGLGLAITQAIARVHTGSVRVENTEAGTVLFTMILPKNLKAPIEIKN